MYQTVVDGARASSALGEGDAQIVMVDDVSVSAASSAKGTTSKQKLHDVGGASASAARSARSDAVSVSATSSVQAVARQEVLTVGGASVSIARDAKEFSVDHLRLLTAQHAGAVEPRQREVVRYHRGFRMPPTESRKLQHAVW